LGVYNRKLFSNIFFYRNKIQIIKSGALAVLLSLLHCHSKTMIILAKGTLASRASTSKKQAKEEEKMNFIHIYLITLYLYLYYGEITKFIILWWQSLTELKMGEHSSELVAHKVASSAWQLYEVLQVCWCVALYLRPNYWLFLFVIIPFAFQNHLVLKVIFNLKLFPILPRRILGK